ncbi:MAG: hypothetical protein ABI663_16820 [Chryseolinea sp.]
MKLLIKLLFIVPLLMSPVVVCGQNQLNTNFTHYSGDYLGMPQPSTQPLKFSPDFISTNGQTNQCLVFSPDGNHLVYVWADSIWSKYGMVYSRRIGNRWLDKTLLKYIGSDQVPFNPIFSLDSKQIIFSMISTAWPNTDLYALDLLPSGYAMKPERLNIAVNTEGLDFDIFIDKDSTIYFTGKRDDFVGGTFDIYQYKKQHGKDVVTNLHQLNSPLDDAAPYLSPDGSYMVFEKMVNENNLVYNDSTARLIRIELFVSFRNKNQEWSVPINLGDKINSKINRTYRPFISADGKFLFYTQRNNKESAIYWVSTKVIEKLRPH